MEDGSWGKPGVGDREPGAGVEKTNNGGRVTGGVTDAGVGLCEKKT